MSAAVEFEESIEKLRKELLQKFEIEGLSATFVSLAEFRKVMEKHYRDVFEHAASRFTYDDSELARVKNVMTNYAQVHKDFIILRDKNDNFVGHFSGESEDMCTYYLRNAGLTAEWRRKGIASTFMQYFCDYLYEIGYSRVTSQHHGNNNAVLIMMLKFGFHICGVECREEWGTLVKCVKLLNTKREELFHSAIYGV